MSEAGLSVFNTHGTLQIDSTFSNYTLIRSARILSSLSLNYESTDWAGGGSANVPIVTISGTNPILAVRSNVGTRSYRVRNVDGTFSFFIMRSDPDPDPASFYCTYYVFDRVPGVSGTYGLQVFNAAGSIVYDSNFYYMRQAGNIQDTSLPWPEPGMYRSWTRDYILSAEKPALVTCVQGAKFSLIVTGDPGASITETILVAVSGKIFNGDNARFSCYEEFQYSSSGGGGPGFVGTTQWRSLVVDVANLPEDYAAV